MTNLLIIYTFYGANVVLIVWLGFRHKNRLVKFLKRSRVGDRSRSPQSWLRISHFVVSWKLVSRISLKTFSAFTLSIVET